MRDTARIHQRHHRDLDTRVGTIDAAVPQPTRSFSLAGRPLPAAIATCCFKGVSTHRMNDLDASVGTNNLSKSQVLARLKTLKRSTNTFASGRWIPNHIYMSRGMHRWESAKGLLLFDDQHRTPYAPRQEHQIPSSSNRDLGKRCPSRPETANSVPRKRLGSRCPNQASYFRSSPA